MAILSAQEKVALDKQNKTTAKRSVKSALSVTKKCRIESRVIKNSQFKFCGRIFGCPQITEQLEVLIAFNAFRDAEVDVFSESGDFLGVACWERGLEVCNG